MFEEGQPSLWENWLAEAGAAGSSSLRRLCGGPEAKSGRHGLGEVRGVVDDSRENSGAVGGTLRMNLGFLVSVMPWCHSETGREKGGGHACLG